MQDGCPGKKGFTLVEALVVVTIMGVLSGIGVASLRDAVANSRIKDAGINVTAFMQRAANEATRLNERLAVKVEGDKKTLKLYKCNSVDDNGICNDFGDVVDEMTLESSNKFVTGQDGGTDCPELGDESARNPKAVMTLTPRVGVSPISSGCFLLRYGGSDRFAASIKSPTKYAMYYKLSYDEGANWCEF